MRAQRKLWVLSLSLVTVAIYVFAFFGEILLTYLLRPRGEASVERVVKEDIPQRKQALNEGLSPVITPANIVGKSLMSLAMELGVAPLAPQPNSHVYYCNEGYGLIRYHTDRFGFRNADVLWRSKIDAVLIGDSFTHGACVEDSDTISGGLSSRFSVLNLGTSGNNPVHYAALAKTFIPHVKPRWAVLVFYTNDFYSGGRYSYYYRVHFANKVSYFDPLATKLQISDKIIQFYKRSETIVRAEITSDLEGNDLRNQLSTSPHYWSADRFSLKSIRREIRRHLFAVSPPSELPFSSRLAIDTLIAACSAYRCTPVIAYVARKDRRMAEYFSDRYAHLLAEYALKNGLKFVDTRPALDTLGSDGYAKLGAHLSPQGYHAVADELARALSN